MSKKRFSSKAGSYLPLIPLPVSSNVSRNAYPTIPMQFFFSSLWYPNLILQYANVYTSGDSSLFSNFFALLGNKVTNLRLTDKDTGLVSTFYH